MNLNAIGEGFKDANILGAELQVHGALHGEGQALVPYITVALHHCHTRYGLLEQLIIHYIIYRTVI